MPFLKDKRKLQTNSNAKDNLSKKNGLKHATFTVHDDKYIGEWKNNHPEGKGSYLSRTYKLYEGDWTKNFRHGFGVLSIRQENKVYLLRYRGDWKIGHFGGYGASSYLDGGYYMGYWKNSKRHGYGQMWYADGAFYDGAWRRDMRHGLGMLVRVDGNRYEGSWAFDLKHGRGRFFHLDSGQMQEGVWHNDICVCSYVVDILFRQAAIRPTPCPIEAIKTINIEKMYSTRELEALDGSVDSCRKLFDVLHTSE